MQHHGIHPDDLLPADHPARQLTPDEIGIIAGFCEDWITTNENLLGQMLHQLPQIPLHAADRRLWAAGLPDRERVTYEDAEQIRAHLKPITVAVDREDWRTLLYLLTQARPGDVERAVRKDLYDIRDAVEKRLGDAVAAAIGVGEQARAVSGDMPKVAVYHHVSRTSDTPVNVQQQAAALRAAAEEAGWEVVEFDGARLDGEDTVG
jgi:hypothetical protein